MRDRRRRESDSSHRGQMEMSQNRPQADREGVIAGFRRGREAGEVLATLVKDRGKDL